MSDQGGDWLKANPDIDAREIQVGMAVMGSDGRTIGQIKQVRASDFLVNREFARDVYIPLSHVVRIGSDDRGVILEEHVLIDVESSRVDNMNWERP